MKNKGLSRRAFLGSALAGSTIAALGLAGCAPSTASQAAAEKAPASDLASTSSNPSFLNAPEPIADADITTTKDADVVIVGCGIAGMAAARAATDEGAKVVVIEKSERFNCRGAPWARSWGP